MIYTIYRTTNLLNGKFYVGIHKTENPEDEYLGSGKLIRAAVLKYGESNFRKEILFEFDSADEAFAKEEELVELHKNNPLCYNLKKGGSGGFDYINENGFSALGGRRSTEGRRRKAEADPVYREKLAEVGRRNLRKALGTVPKEIVLLNLEKATKAWMGSHHSPEYCQRRSQELRGTLNPRYGTVWVNLGGQEQAVSKEEASRFVSCGWLLGRRKKVWAEPFKEIAKPRPIRLGKPTQGVVRESRKKPKSEWNRKLPNWPPDSELLKVVSEMGQRAFARQFGVSNVAVHNRIKKITGSSPSRYGTSL